MTYEDVRPLDAPSRRMTTHPNMETPENSAERWSFMESYFRYLEENDVSEARLYALRKSSSE